MGYKRPSDIARLTSHVVLLPAKPEIPQSQSAICIPCALLTALQTAMSQGLSNNPTKTAQSSLVLAPEAI